MLMQTFLSNEPSKTLDSSTTFNFMVTVRFSNLLFIVGWFGCFLGHPIRFNERFLFSFLMFCYWWDVKIQGGFLLSFEGFVSIFS